MAFGRRWRGRAELISSSRFLLSFSNKKPAHPKEEFFVKNNVVLLNFARISLSKHVCKKKNVLYWANDMSKES